LVVSKNGNNCDVLGFATFPAERQEEILDSAGAKVINNEKDIFFHRRHSDGGEGDHA
jgi:hypothetical protein